MSNTVAVGPANPEDSGSKSVGRDEEVVFTKVLKMFNIAISLITIGFSVYCYFGFSPTTTDGKFSLDDPSMLILPGYVALSGLIILAVETQTKIIHSNMSFLLNYFGRGIYNIYVGILCLSMVQQLVTQIRDGQTDVYAVAVYTSAGLLTFMGLCYIAARLFCCARSPAEERLAREQRMRETEQERKLNDDSKA